MSVILRALDDLDDGARIGMSTPTEAATWSGSVLLRPRFRTGSGQARRHESVTSCLQRRARNGLDGDGDDSCSPDTALAMSVVAQCALTE